MFMLKRERAAEITNNFAGKRIIVLGDLMLDEFIFGRVRRISPEAPVPVVEVEKQTLALGGAGNVVSNLVGLGASPVALGVVGDDMDAERMRLAFEKSGVNTESIVVDARRPTTLKTRIIAHNQQVVRADRENRQPISKEIEDRIIAIFHREMEKSDALIVSDYSKGLLTTRLLAEVLALASERKLTVCLDPKTRSFLSYQPVTIITPNHQEASEATGIAIENEQSLTQAGQKILDSIDCRAALITRGEEGMALFTDEGAVTYIPTVAREVYDVTGAGDTVIATLALALATGATFVESAILANYAAGVVVGKLGTATVTREELLSTI